MKFKNIYKTILIIFVYIIVNIFFHNQLWSELFFDHSKENAVYGEQIAIEWGQEKVYDNIKAGKNPFNEVKDILYPFGANFISSDSGNAFFFPLLRPFMSAHQATSIIWAVEVILANLGMFFLLRCLGLPYLVSMLIGLCFGYMTFLMTRIGHMSYYTIYVFPWFYYSLLNLIKQKSNHIKFIYSLFTSLFFVLALYHNLYYFIMIILSIGFLLIYLIFKEKEFLVKIIKNNIAWFFLSFIGMILLASPWLQIVYETYKFDSLPKVEGWGGAISFSSDLFNYFIPSVYSYFLGRYSEWFGLRFQFANGIFESFTYPGLVIIGSIFIGLLLIVKKRINKTSLRLILPNLFIAFGFWILTLGPFLHILGKWHIPLDEGIKIIIPLPYIILHYIPFLNNIRSPGRLIVGFIFFAYIASAFIITYLLKNKTKTYKVIFFTLFIVIIIIDHYFQYSASTTPKYLPLSLYKTIKDDKNNITVMEAPSVVRDGFTYFGDQSGFNFFISQLLYNKPVLAGYFGRVPAFKRNYYINNPALGYFGRLMDENISTNGSIDQSDLLNWQKLDIEKAKDSLDFLDVGYFIIDNDRSYSATISADLVNLDFNKIMDDKNFSLWKREVNQKEFLNANIGKDDEIYLGMGWNNKEIDGRWTWNKSTVMFKTVYKNRFNLSFEAKSFYKDIKTTIYLNKKKIGQVIIPQNNKKITIPINFDVNPGVHTIHFIFDKSYSPSNLYEGNSDKRLLSVKFKSVALIKLE